MKSVITTFKAMRGKSCLLSSSLYGHTIEAIEANENQYTLRNLLSRELNRNDLGKEVGSLST